MREHRIAKLRRYNKPTKPFTIYLSPHQLLAIETLQTNGYSSSRSEFIRDAIHEYNNKVKLRKELSKLMVQDDSVEEKNFKIVTCSITLDELESMTKFIDEKWYLSNSELIRNAVEDHIDYLLELIYRDDIPEIKKDQIDYRPELNMKNKINQIQERFGTPRKVYKGMIYEFRFNEMKNPRWVCVGIAENEI